MTEPKPRLKSKTYRFAAALAGLGAALQYLPMLQELVTPTVYAWSYIGIAVVVAILRERTSQPVR